MNKKLSKVKVDMKKMETIEKGANLGDFEFWFDNHWHETDYTEIDGLELFLISIFQIELFGLWIDFWAIDITVLNFTFGFRLNLT